MLTFAENGHPVFQSTSPLSRGVLKSKGGGKLSIHFCADGDTVETVLRTIISVYQLSIYGAVSDLCEECKTCHVRTGRPVVARHSEPLFVPSVMKTHIPLTDEPAQQEDILQRYQERVERLSQQDKPSKPNKLTKPNEPSKLNKPNEPNKPNKPKKHKKPEKTPLKHF